MDSPFEDAASPQARDRGTNCFQFEGLLQRDGWITPAFVRTDARGIIKEITHNRPDDISVEVVNGFALPGFQNAHSHAFQYAMAGMAERHGVNSVDDFWTWREAMYRTALTLDPDQMQGIAAMLYAEMLKRGYTHVAEFHYLHHDKNGKPYANHAEMSVSLVAAAAIAGIRITLIPVFYQKGGFGKDAEPTQRRFCFDTIDRYWKLVEDCAAVVRDLSTAALGFGVHSLRAAEIADIKRILHEGPRHLPFHIHAAEQLREVNECVQYINKRPVECLLDHLPVDERFHVIHCTHLSDDEMTGLARAGAHVVLCPGTEANLGDGIFRLSDFIRMSNNWSIGTDSHVSLSPLEDLRWLDYTQRLTTHRRNTFADGASTLVMNTFFSGKRAMGLSQNYYFQVGSPLDAVVYDTDFPLLKRPGVTHLLPTLVYTADAASILGTIVDGRWIVRDGSHKNYRKILREFSVAIRSASEQA